MTYLIKLSKMGCLYCISSPTFTLYNFRSDNAIGSITAAKLLVLRTLSCILQYLNKFISYFSPLFYLSMRKYLLCDKQDDASFSGKYLFVCFFFAAYEPLKLMQTVMAKTNEVCLRYLDNSMLCSLPAPGPPNNIVSVCAVKNRRRCMEDRHVVIHDLNTMFNIQVCKIFL